MFVHKYILFMKMLIEFWNTEYIFFLGDRWQQTLVVKTGSDRPNAKRSAIGVSVTRRWPVLNDAPCHSSRGTLKNPRCSMVMSAEHRSNIAALHR